jgi:vanillate/3-O-methylgallate O-demethylase
MNALGGPLKMLRNSPLGVYRFPVVQPEYTNWVDEQRSWMTGVALSNLSFHMTHLYLRGPDVLAFLKHVSCTRLGDFPVNRGKQLMVVNHQGHFIGDNVAFHTSDGVFRLSGPDTVTHWLQYQLETGKWDVQAEKDASQNFRGGDPLIYSYQIQGPHAVALMKEVCDGPFPELKFFHIGEFSIAGVPVRALRHGMAGVPGFELFGPWSDASRIMEALETAGEKYRLCKLGGRTYPTTCLESGWLAMPVPAIYTGDDMKPYREWLSTRTVEVLGSVGGSFASDDIEDYYMTTASVATHWSKSHAARAARRWRWSGMPTMLPRSCGLHLPTRTIPPCLSSCR